MKTKYMILAMALLLAPTAMAQDYFAKLRYYFGENSPIVKQENTLTIHNTYYTSLNGEKEGELTIYKFKLPKSKAEYIDSVKVLYDAIDQLLDDIAAGKKYMKVYRQMRLYNDPATNPVLYGKK